ncbi:glycerol-3-phosphate responsive antiterminator GlpP [Paenibacillus yonginensis]|uniref:Glycerol uptake operon antiterminator regulatory protein n=1 Tax=Paenibacillus yonginensis TaxID=1462996 RepID=A0A1B1N607_9BACL|nr:glycerol-3-phosphate responsive antiterminator [Paenibacillus yonginensis]ANS76870.1 glycerol-3-phosphate responsive antiterminator GlpP [Paenibacillus yonginensis]
MPFGQQYILPAVKTAKEMEAVLDTPYVYLVLLGGRLARLRPLIELAERAGKQVLLHADLVDELKNDEYAAEYLCQAVRPAGLISTRSSVVQKAKQNKLVAVQRMFLIDSGALESNYALFEKNPPDYIEVLPGIVPSLIQEVKARTGIPIIAGGFIRTPADVEAALAAGAQAITTSRQELWCD